MIVAYSEIPPEVRLDRFYILLQNSKAAPYFERVHSWPSYRPSISLKHPDNSKYDDPIINIFVDKDEPEFFTYHVLTNEPFGGMLAYQTIESKDGATAEQVIDAVYKFLKGWTPEPKWPPRR